MPDPRFMSDMGIASILAGIVLLVLAHVSRVLQRRSR